MTDEVTDEIKKQAEDSAKKLSDEMKARFGQYKKGKVSNNGSKKGATSESPLKVENGYSSNKGKP